MNYYTHPSYAQARQHPQTARVNDGYPHERTLGYCPVHGEGYGFTPTTGEHKTECKTFDQSVIFGDDSSVKRWITECEAKTDGQVSQDPRRLSSITDWNPLTSDTTKGCCKWFVPTMSKQEGRKALGKDMAAGAAAVSTALNSLLSSIKGMKIKSQGDMTSLVSKVKEAARTESGTGVSISVSVPAKAEGWDAIKQYAAGIKKVKSALGSAPKTAGAVTTAAGWFWTNVEKPAMPQGATSASGSGGTSSSSGNPYSNVPANYSPLTMMPFWRKNNAWMYGSIALVVGVGVWAVWYRE
jgi:hypothetical protein